MSTNIACPQCGASVSPNTRFCPDCGYPIQAEFYQSSRPTPGPVQPTQKMDEPPDFSPYTPPAVEPDYYAEPAKPRSRRMWYILGGGLALFACCAIAGIMMIVSALNGDGGFSLSLFDTATPTATATATHTATPTITPTPPPTDTPVPPTPTEPVAAPTEGGPALTGSQRLTDIEFFDDFSSSALSWSERSDENSVIGYENGAYSILVSSSDYLQLVRPPLEDLTRLEFTANAASGGENGMYGVACYFDDIDNFVYVGFDGATQNLRFAQYVGDEWSQLSDWMKHSVPLQNAKYTVDCTQSAMVAYINNTVVGQIQVSKADGPFSMWVFVSTWEDATGGMKVLFDDAYGAYTP